MSIIWGGEDDDDVVEEVGEVGEVVSGIGMGMLSISDWVRRT